MEEFSCLQAVWFQSDNTENRSQEFTPFFCFFVLEHLSIQRTKHLIITMHYQAYYDYYSPVMILESMRLLKLASISRFEQIKRLRF